MTTTDYFSIDSDARPPQASDQCLKGQYRGVVRSQKGKIKALKLQSGDRIYTIKLPKHLRPLLTRELPPDF
jgi:hypothetical protein